MERQATRDNRPIHLVQITDTHLGFSTGDELLGLNTDESLDDVLKLISRERGEPDVMVCTGDIASAGHHDCYHRLVEAVRHHFSGPLGWLPGNHDSAEAMSAPQLAKLAEARLMDLGPWLLVLLDSSVPSHVYGQLADSELAFLEQTLSASPDKHVMVMLHHQPVPVGSAWIDQYILRNADAFFTVIDRHAQVKAVVWGHVHQAFEKQRRGVSLLAAPATCIQFKPNSDEFAVDSAMPGYRWFELHADGRFSTGISRVSGKTYAINYQSSGY